MTLAILSDIHDHVWNLRAALPACGQADALICCGDLCSPFVVNMMAEGFAGPIHIVFGNNDGDQYRISQNAANYGGRVRIHGEFAVLPKEQYGLRIAVNHYPAIAEGLAASGKYDLVCYGHDHTLRVDVRPGVCSLVNPGPIMGYDPIARADVTATFVVLDTEDLTGYVFGATDGTLAMWPIGAPAEAPAS